MRRYWAAAALALILVVAPAGIVSAHAALVRADPPQGAAMQAAPAKVILDFSEAVEPNFSRVQLLDRGGARLNTGPVRPTPDDPTELSVTLPPSVASGIYTVLWQVTSQDGHVVQGAYAFSVGAAAAADLDAAAAAADGQGAAAPPPLTGVVLHWLQYAAALLATGVAASALLVLPALGPHGLRQALSGRAAALAAAAGIALLAAYLLLLPAHTAQVASVPWWQALRPALLWRVAAGSNWGRFWLLGLPLAALQLLAARGSGGGWPGLLGAVVAGLLLLLTLALSGHAATLRDNAWVAIGADWLHLTGAAFWLGGLPLLLPAARSLATADPGALRRLVRRFSALAVGSVGLILLTGLYQSLLLVPAWDALVATAYGRTLLVKLALVLLLLALGAYNLLATGPRLERSVSAAGGLSRAVRAEIALAAGVLAAVAVLTALPPARVAYTRPFVATAAADDLRVRLQVDPDRAGYNHFDAQVTDAAGRPVNDALRVRLQMTMATHSMGTVTRDLLAGGDGHYRSGGSELSMVGPWNVRVQVRRSGLEDVSAAFTVEVADTP